MLDRLRRYSWSDCPVVYGNLPAPPPPAPPCPHCGSSRTPDYVRVEDLGDGSILRKAVCRRCGERFRMVLEPIADAGNDDLDLGIIQT